MYIIFSDDINWCQNNIVPILNKPHHISKNNEFVDLFLMSKCHNNIIANSSYSWWGSYLNKNDNITIVPDKWFGDKGPPEHDLFLPNWIKINSDY